MRQLHINRKGKLAFHRDPSDRIVVLSLATLLGMVGVAGIARWFLR